AADAGEAGDDVLGPVRLHGEELAVVDDSLDDLAHVVGPAGRRRHDVVELLDPAVDGVAALPNRRRLLVVTREERQVAAHGRQALGVVGYFEVGDAADLRVHGRAAHLFFGDV